MTELNEAPDAEEALVLVGYASLMESVQNLEWALKRLVIQEDEGLNDFSFDEAWKRAEKILLSALGVLEGQVPAGLAAEISRLRRIRNQLAHEVLIRWRFETNIGLAMHAEVVNAFVEISNEFDSFSSQIDELADERLSEMGIDSAQINLSAADLRKILSDPELDE